MHRAPPIFFEHRQQGFVADQSPVAAVMVAGRRLAGKAFDDQVGPQPPQYLDEQVDVLADLPETEPAGVGIVLGGHRRAAENLQLVEFHRRERQRIDRCDLLQQHFIGLARQPEDEMRPHVQPPFGSHLHGTAGAGEVVAAVHGAQRLVAGRFDAEFDRHVTVTRYLRQIIELLGVHAVGARPDDDTRHAGICERLAVERPEPFERGVGIRKRLEINQVARRRTVAPAVEFDPLGDLLSDAFGRDAVRGSERPVITERTSSLAYLPVAVGTREPGIDRDFLHPPAERAAEIPRIGVKPPVVAPRIHAYNPQSEAL